ncbi:MAG: 2-C-methyl-D-erythritol 4-phosphate cytidylyltransferase [Chloroflexota bacterium]|nr:2-C-methyl-D-erythritol 4-phosphate cytidylyltransferase [Chloroflexota bacterium]
MNETGTRAGAIIVAAGSSTRMMGDDKIFAPLGQESLLAKVVNVFQNCTSIDEIVIVLATNNLERGRRLVHEYNWTKVTAVCAGGVRRQDSVRQGLGNLHNCDWVVIHDGARPCISADIIERGLTTAQRSGAAIAAVPVKDTIKIVSPLHVIEQTPLRERMWLAQTPQVFRYDLIVEAYNQIDADVTDDASLVERLGYSVDVYMGSYQNIKVTTPEDLAIAEIFVSNREKA